MTNSSNTESMDWSVKSVVTFTSIYLVIGMILAAKKHNWEFVFYIPIIVIFGLLALSIRRRANFPNALLWMLSVWGLLHIIGGVVDVPESWPVSGNHRSVYNWQIIPGWLVYDKPVHAFGFGVATWACWRGILSICGNSRFSFGRLMLAVLAGLGLGALNEVVEFVASQTMDTNVGGYINTGGDLIANTVGATVAAIMITAKYSLLKSSH